MAIPLQHNIEIFQGDYYSADVAITDDNDNPINLSAFNLSGTIKSDYCTESGLLDFDISKIQNGTGGLFTISLPSDGTAALNPSLYYYAIRGESGSVYVKHLLVGNLFIQPIVF